MLRSQTCAPIRCGIVSWWRAEQDGNDFLGLNNGTLMNGALFSPGKVGQAFDFDGSSQYLQIADSPSLNPKGSFSFEAWIFPRVDGEQAIIQKWAASADYPNQRSYNFSTLPGRGLRFAISDDANQGNGSFHLFDTTNNVIALNAWNHVAATYDQATGTRRIYVNGSKVAERTDPPITLTTSSVPVTIGTEIASATSNLIYFNGLIDELAVYNYALSDADVSAIFAASGTGKCTVLPAPQIVAQPQAQTVTAGSAVAFNVFADCSTTLYQWHLNGSDVPGASGSTFQLHNVQASDAGTYSVTLSNSGGSVVSSNASLTVNLAPCLTQPAGLIDWWQAGGNAMDSAGTNHGTLQGATTFSSGMVGQAFSFDGLNSFVEIPDSPNLDFAATAPLTVEMWVYRTGSQTPMHLLGKRAANCGAFQYQLAIGPGDDIGFYGGSGSAVANYQVPLNTWIHLAATFTAGRFQLYTNGVLAATGSGNLGPAVSAPLKIGGAGDCASFQGLLDEVSIYNRALAPSEIQNLYLSAASGKCGPSTPAGIFSQPLSQIVYAGSNVSLSVASSGTAPIAYGWNFNGAAISGATNSTLNLTNVQSPLAGNYAVVLTNPYGRATSSIAVLQVISTPPSFVLQPQSQSVYLGNDVRFPAVVSGSPALAYQWRLNGTNLAGATSNALALTNVQANQAGSYSLLVTNYAGAVASSNAVLTVLASACVAPPTNLVGWWSGEGNGNNVTGSNHGILATNISFVPGKVGQAFAFTGTGTVQIADAPNLNFSRTSSMTMELWACRTGLQTTMHLMGKRQPGCGSIAYQMSFDPTGLLFVTDNGAVRTGVQMPMNKWIYLSGTFDGATLRFYTNGVLAATGTGTLGPTNNAPLIIGGSDACPPFVGLLDEVTLYNRVLSAAEILSIYNASTRGKCVLAPAFVTNPQSMTVSAGTNVTFTPSLAGSYPFVYQWTENGTAIPGATNSSLSLSNVSSAGSGAYRLTVLNPAGSVTSPAANLKVVTVYAYGNGQLLTNSNYGFPVPVSVQLQNAYTNGYIFYTLDGTTPSFNSVQYAGTFTITNDSILRAIGYSADFYQSGQLDPVTIAFPPHFSIAVTSSGGGSVSLNPTNNFYLSNAVVNLTAVPASGWTFFQWLGDATGTNAGTAVTMNHNKNVQAVFGTTLSTTAAGGGTVVLNPAGGLYPYGTTVQLSAVPQAGNYFGIWGNAASGNVNPLLFTLTNPAPVVSSLFASLGAGQVALTVVPVGRGRVAVSPRANSYAAGQSVTITAVPDAGQSFVGWGGDAGGAQNPLSLNLDTGKIVYADFTLNHKLSFQFSPQLPEEGFRLTLPGEFATAYQFSGSSNLVNWTPLVTLTNSFGVLQYTDYGVTNGNRRFYQATPLP